MLKRMLGIDPAEIKSHIEELANAAKGVHVEQVRLTDFQNLLAKNAIKQNDELAGIGAELAHVRHDIANVRHDIANVMQALVVMHELLREKASPVKIDKPMPSEVGRDD